MKGISYRCNHTCFSRNTLKALKSTWITARQIKTERRPVETHMGSGKGFVEY